MTDVAPREPAIALLTHLGKVIQRHSTEERLGLRWRHFVALWVLSCESDCAQQQALCERMLMDANNCVLLLNEIEALGYITRRRDPADRRRHLVALTDAGREAYAHSIRARLEIEDEVLHALDGSEREQLRTLLEKAMGRD